MDISLAWLNALLSPGDVSADEADTLLTQAGLPIEGRETRPGGDTVLDVEVTSNRVDCLSHLGCAREVAALSGRSLAEPDAGETAGPGDAASALALSNEAGELCPLFTARVFRGCRVGPSPAWLVERLEAIGQRPINNVVDVTNYVMLELGNPSHVFDLAGLAPGADGRPAIVVRGAHEGERLRTLDGKDRALAATDLVVADGARATSLAGVIGGAESEVSAETTDVVLEVATWEPVTVRTQARRHGVTTEAGYRFQRGIDARTVAAASVRAAALIRELSGGEPVGGVLSVGGPPPELRVVTLRPSRASLVLGIEVGLERAAEALGRLGVGVEATGADALRCTIPPWRDRDLTREADLIEEVARVVGYDAVPVREAVAVRVRPAQARPRAVRELGRVLTGLGFDETVTFSFTSPARAALFLPGGSGPAGGASSGGTPLGGGLAAVSVDEARRADEPTLRPSVLAGLLSCRRQNQDARSAGFGAVRLFEVASSFAQRPHAESGGRAGASAERACVGLLMDVPGPAAVPKRSHAEIQLGLRAMRGVIDAAARAMHGAGATVSVVPLESAPAAAWDASAAGAAFVRTPGGETLELGRFGLVGGPARREFGLESPAVAAELWLDEMVSGFPPRSSARPLPAFPHIERDLSFVVGEGVRFGELEAVVLGLGLESLEGVEYVGAYRGEQVGAGKKSATLRLRFRDPSRTLRHEEVDPQMAAVVAAVERSLGGVLRG